MFAEVFSLHLPREINCVFLGIDFGFFILIGIRCIKLFMVPLLRTLGI